MDLGNPPLRVKIPANQGAFQASAGCVSQAVKIEVFPDLLQSRFPRFIQFKLKHNPGSIGSVEYQIWKSTLVHRADFHAQSCVGMELTKVFHQYFFKMFF